MSYVSSKTQGIFAGLAGPLKLTIEHLGDVYDPYCFARSGTPAVWGEGLEHEAIEGDAVTKGPGSFPVKPPEAPTAKLTTQDEGGVVDSGKSLLALAAVGFIAFKIGKHFGKRG